MGVGWGVGGGGGGGGGGSGYMLHWCSVCPCLCEIVTCAVPRLAQLVSGVQVCMRVVVGCLRDICGPARESSGP